MADPEKDGTQFGGKRNQTTARVLLDPCTRHAFTSMPSIGGNLSESCPLPGSMDLLTACGPTLERLKQTIWPL
jgi:hypothetical protein